MEIIPSLTPAFRRGYRVQWEEKQNTHVMLYPEGMAKLNESAAAILHCVDGKSTIDAISAGFRAQFPDAQGIEDDVLAFFAAAYQQKWLTFS